MKKLTILFAALFMVSAISKLNAQTFSIGPTAGFGHSWITNIDGDGKFNPMWSAGFSFIYSNKTNFGIGVDIKYSSEGNKKHYKPGDNGSTVDFVGIINENYIRVPVKIIYFAAKYGSAVRPKLYVGPSFGFLTSANQVYDDDKTKQDIKRFMKSFDFGITAGAGLNFRLASKTWLNTDLAFYQGLSNITKNQGTTQHNGNLGVNVGLLLGL